MYTQEYMRQLGDTVRRETRAEYALYEKLSQQAAEKREKEKASGKSNGSGRARPSRNTAPAPRNG